MSTENKSLWVAVESSYSVDPDSDGSDYVWVPAEDVSFLKSSKKPIPTQYATGRPWPTPALEGPDGGEITFKVPLIGLITSPAAGASPSATLTYLEIFLRHIMGGVRTLPGVAVTAGTSGTFSAATDPYNAQDLVPVYEAGVPSDSARTQWAPILSQSGAGPYVYTVEPDFETAPSNAAIVRGTRLFTFDGDGGDTLAFYAQDDDETFTLLGCRITSASISDEPQMRAMMSVTVQYDQRVAGSKASIPDASNGPAIAEIVGVNAPVFFNGSQIDTAKTTFDFGIQASAIKSRAGTNGRSGHDVVHLRPKITINPIGGSTYEDLMHDVTEGECLLQYGAGVLASSVLNTIAIYFPLAQVMEASRSDDDGRRRVDLTIELKDEVMFSAGVASKALQIGVA